MGRGYGAADGKNDRGEVHSVTGLFRPEGTVTRPQGDHEATLHRRRVIVQMGVAEAAGRVTDEGRRKPASGRIDQLFSNIGRVLDGAAAPWQSNPHILWRN